MASRHYKDFEKCFFNDLYAFYYKGYALDSDCDLSNDNPLFWVRNTIKKWCKHLIISNLLKILFLFIFPFYYIFSLLVFAYIYSKILILSTRSIDKNASNEIAFVFDKVSYERVKIFNKNYDKAIPCYGDYFSAIGDNSFFKVLSIYKKLSLVPRIFIIGNCILLRSLRFYTQMKLPWFWNLFSIGYLVKRLYYTSAVGVVIEEIIASGNFSVIYSGLRDERYAHILSTVCNKYGINTCCLPHGLCYNFNYPNGLFGNTYLAFNNSEMNFIKSRYPEKKVDVFRWEEETFKKDRLDVVYFTTSRDVDADRMVLEHLLKLKNIVYVRLHPNDSAENYKLSGLYFLDDYSKGINAEIVISRPSTVLVEAERSGAKICVILLSNDDLNRYDLYPAFSQSYYKIRELKDINLITDGNP